MEEERYNDIMIVVKYREPNEYHQFDNFLDDMKLDDNYAQIDVVTLFQAWLRYKNEDDFKSSPIKYMKKLDE